MIAPAFWSLHSATYFSITANNRFEVMSSHGIAETPLSQDVELGQDVEQLHKRFRALSLLLTFFAAWDDHNGLATQDAFDILQERMSRMGRSGGQSRIIDTVLAILVLDDELLAGMSYRKPMVPLTCPPGGLVVMMQSTIDTLDKSDDLGDIPPLDVEGEGPKMLNLAAIPNSYSRATTIPNPRSDDEEHLDETIPNPSDIFPFIINSGKNHWDSIMGVDDFMYSL